MRFLSTVAIFALTCVSVVGCGQKRSTIAAPAAKPADAKSVSALVAAGAPKDAPADAVPEKKPRFSSDAPVYVDGKPAGVIRFVELPSSVKGKVIKLPQGYEQTNFTFYDYLTAIGVDLAKVQSLHLYGGKRVVVVDAKELHRLGPKLQFSFLRGDRGKVRMEWPAQRLNVNTTIDMLTRVAVYVDKAPPHMNENNALVMPDGTVVAEDKMPYVDSEQGNGTRVYVDGAFVATVKRRKLGEDLRVPAADAQDARFSLAGYTRTLGVDGQKAQAIDFVSGDDVVGRVDGPSAKQLSFSLPRHNQGRISVDLPSTESASVASAASDPQKLTAVETSPVRVSAVQIFVKTTPPARKLVDPKSVADMGGGGGGSGSGGATANGAVPAADDE
jgi:hypothetical protein